MRNIYLFLNKLWHKACASLASIVLTEKLYARNPFDRRHDFAADRCIVTWPHGRSSVYYRGGELQPQIGSQQYMTGTGPKGADLGNWEVLMPLVQLVLVLT